MGFPAILLGGMGCVSFGYIALQAFLSFVQNFMPVCIVVGAVSLFYLVYNGDL